MKVSAVGNGHIESQPGFIQGGLDFAFLNHLDNRLFYAPPSELRRFASEHPKLQDALSISYLSDAQIRELQSELISRYTYPTVAVATAGVHAFGDPISFDPDNPTGSLTNLLNLGINAGVGYVENEAGLRTPATSPTPGQVATPGAAPPAALSNVGFALQGIAPLAIAGIALFFLMKRK